MNLTPGDDSDAAYEPLISVYVLAVISLLAMVIVGLSASHVLDACQSRRRIDTVVTE